jgi:hypothetical protein
MKHLFGSLWSASPFEQKALGQMLEGVPPYWGEWGVVEHGSGGYMKDAGKVGPFSTIEQAMSAAAQAAVDHGAELMPRDGFAQVKDSRGEGVGPII